MKPIPARPRPPTGRQIVEAAASSLAALCSDPVSILDGGDVVVVVARGKHAKLVNRTALVFREADDARIDHLIADLDEDVARALGLQLPNSLLLGLPFAFALQPVDGDENKVGH